MFFLQKYTTDTSYRHNNYNYDFAITERIPGDTPT